MEAVLLRHDGVAGEVERLDNVGDLARLRVQHLERQAALRQAV